MCRLLVYKGKEPILLSHLLTRPAHSIINQAFASKLRLDLTRGPINGDGFGVGWYDSSEPVSASTSSSSPSSLSSTPSSTLLMSPSEEKSETEAAALVSAPASLDQMDPQEEINAIEGPPVYEDRLNPCIFNSITPAWNNENLGRLAEKIRSPMIFAHVRASTAGALSEQNCHPWNFGRLMWMHNGGIASFHLIKRRLQQSLPENLFLFPQGTTDSEWAFALFLSFLPQDLLFPEGSDVPGGKCNKSKRAQGRFSTRLLQEAMLKTIRKLNEWTKQVGATEPSLMNFCVTDGESVVVTRYVSSKTQEAASLFYSSGTSFTEYPLGSGSYRMSYSSIRPDPLIMIASEPLTFERTDWREISTNTMVVITPNQNLLQIPIIDEFSSIANPESDLILRAGKKMAFSRTPSTSSLSAVTGTSRAPAKSKGNGLPRTENGNGVTVGAGAKRARDFAIDKGFGEGLILWQEAGKGEQADSGFHLAGMEQESVSRFY
ncbi:Glucosamine 6-phosphate synthetases, contain amidotransferase and phosphosugar isomerase domains [Phaffia rhodozyma]|uniref:Glucosamine 6-phosphate synthetases, contain amidotransferase and phosphosugar isomerase domains n=1 Tax=Phaffia rhodozyma TaxID=264483 RepID=A0A0F7SJ66_PHARH|nr:Glucosamine 6-phosphate synthetases, contain amidotransferase and phosphosugar isomerase domains [Phaffia rhodozyma]